MASVKARNSRDDRRGAANTSPFRSKAAEQRYLAAMQMVVKRTQEMAALERVLGNTSDIKEQRRLTTRLLATRNNLRSWEAYIADNTPREPRAVITPNAA